MDHFLFWLENTKYSQNLALVLKPRFPPPLGYAWSVGQLLGRKASVKSLLVLAGSSLSPPGGSFLRDDLKRQR